jgi:hypothetical protein
MNQIRGRVVVSPDYRISRTVPDAMPVGEHEVTITVTDRSSKIGRPLIPSDLSAHDLGPWPEGLSLRREDMYDDDGR